MVYNRSSNQKNGVVKMKNGLIKICMVGFGNAGKGFCKLLNEKRKDLQTKYGYNVSITAIATKTKGNLLNYEGIDMERALREVDTYGRFKDPKDLVKISTLELIKESKADVMIELSPLSIHDGQPAIKHIETAFENDMHVITANKGPISWDYRRLYSTAKAKKLAFLYETTVMDGTPIFNLVRETLPGCRVLGFKGILNSTTNFILEAMENGKKFDEAVKEAQRKGFAEADPSLDIDGWDAAAKTTALANVLMEADLTPKDIERHGIRNITQKDIEEAKAAGKKIKLLCEADIIQGKVRGRVAPVEIDENHMFSSIDSTSSCLCLTTDLMGEICVVEKKPEILQTVYGVYSDLCKLLSIL